MAKEMVDLPEGVVLYSGAGAYRKRAPKALFEAYLKEVAKAKAAETKAAETKAAPKPRVK